jgi:hypothetical protein
MALSVAVRNAMLDTQFASGTVYGSLHTASGGSDGSNEIAETGRVELSFAAASGGVTETDAEAAFGAVSGATSPLYVGLWTAATAGTWMGEMAIADPVVLSAGESATFAAGTITVTAE